MTPRAIVRVARMAIPMKTMPVLAPLLILIAFLTPATAQGIYGALATSPDADFGYSYNYGSQEEARRRAMSECSKHASTCSVKGSFSNTCVSVARAGNGAMGWAWGHGRREDDKLAMDECRNNRGNDCTLQARFCTGNP
jgi:uncharacterized protein DUF4189